MSNRKRQVRGAEENWNFFTFPVLVAFIAGVFVTCFLILIDLGVFIGVVHPVLWYAALLGSSFSLAHIFTRQISRHRRERAREREEEEERERRVLAARARAAQVEAQGDDGRVRRRRRRKA
jgi:hypothetical protein